MSETTLKFKPGEYWNIAQYESWFSDMAQQGLHLKKVGLFFARFSKGEPKQTKYRIDLAPRGILPIQKKKYSQKNWGYVTSYGRFSWNNDYLRFNVYSSPTELNAPELCDDLSEQAYQMKCYGSFLLKQMLFNIIGFIIILGGYISSLSIGNDPYLTLLSVASMPFAICILIYLIGILVVSKGFFTIHSLKDSLSNGSAMNHSAPWKKLRYRNIVLYCLLVILTVSACVPPVQIVTGKDRTLPAENNELPIVRLSEIEQNPNLVRKSDYIDDESYDFNNSYSYEWSFFAPVQYEARESGTVPNGKNKDGKGEYSPFVDSVVYKTTIPFINEKVLDDLITRNVNKYERKDLKEIYSSDFDKLFIYKEHNGCEVFAVKGRGIMYVRYYGNADTDTVTAAVLQKINKIA